MLIKSQNSLSDLGHMISDRAPYNANIRYFIVNLQKDFIGLLYNWLSKIFKIFIICIFLSIPALMTNKMANINELQERFQRRVKESLEVLDKQHLRKMQADCFKCSTRCCENTNWTSEDVQSCLTRCQAPVQEAQNFLEGELNNYQVCIITSLVLIFVTCGLQSISYFWCYLQYTTVILLKPPLVD